jgi:curved DNA-binding protein CbpA
VEYQPPASPAAPEPPLHGSLEDDPLPQILRRIFLEQLKGTLTLSLGDEVRQLFFEKGELRTATSSKETQKIGSFLKRRGRIGDEDVTWALSEIARQSGSRFGKKLVERGLLPKSAIDSEMKRLVEEIVFSAFEWESGEFRFEPSSGVIDPDVALSLSTAAIIVEGIRRLPETPLFRERLGNGTRVLRLARDPMSRYQYLPLTPQEAYLLSRIDGLLDLDSLLAIAGSSRSAAAKTVYALLSCGLVEWNTDLSPRRETAGGVSALNVEVSSEPAKPAPGHRELVHNTWRRIDWLSHYDLLGVGREASADEVRRAYLDKSRLFHPDLRHRPDLAGMERELTAVFDRVKAAHDTLVDSDARAAYDQELDQAPGMFSEEVAADPVARRQLAARNFDRAVELIHAKDYFPAVELLREAVHFAPERPEYLFRLGEVELKNENWVERGLENLREATRLAPTRADFLRQTARALAANGRRKDAETYARRANQLEPGPESSALMEEIFGPSTPVASKSDANPEPRRGLFSRLRKKKGG